MFCYTPILFMSLIAKLSSSTSHHLEAEQVIPDLSAAVKELIENSLDSAPSHINVTFVNYGFDSVIIEDDGHGISAENMIEIASNRYATSKITDESDLESSISYGFRGEALHSLVKLSNSVNIFSSFNDSGTGIQKLFTNFGGDIKYLERPKTKGTTVTISGLFEVLSIRRQDWFKRKTFLFAQAIFLLQSFSVLSSAVKISVFHIKENSEKHSVFCCSEKDIVKRYSQTLNLSSSFVSKLKENFLISGEYCEIDGVFAKSKKESKSRLVVFLNQKPFESPKWQKLFHQMLKKNYISGVDVFVNLCLPGMWIDFNVTPDKKTIYIIHEAEILDGFIVILSKALKTDLIVEKNDLPLKNSLPNDSIGNAENVACCIDDNFFEIGSAHSVVLNKDDIKTLVPIGQFNNGFIICYKPSTGYLELFAVDQHAADERIRFEEIAANYSISHQKLVHPIKVELNGEDEDFVANQIDKIRSAGFLAKVTDDGVYIDALPFFHGAASSIDDFKDLISYLKDHGILYKNLCPRFHRVLASRACRSAVMIGAPLTTIQIDKILKKLSETDYPWICAHGRPTVQFLKKLEFDAE